MRTSRRALLYSGVGVMALAAGGMLAWLRRNETGVPSPTAVIALIGNRNLTDLEGRPRTLSDFLGKTLVINFWATWCAPCREEIPLFVRLQNEYAPKKVQFVGIAIDQVDKIRDFAKEFGINYPLLIGGLDAVEMSRKVGNKAGVLPFTLLVGRDGQTAISLVGSITEQDMRQRLDLLLK